MATQAIQAIQAPLPQRITTIQTLQEMIDLHPENFRLNIDRGEKSYGSVHFIPIEMKTVCGWDPIRFVQDFTTLSDPVFANAKYPGARLPFISDEIAKFVTKLIDHVASDVKRIDYIGDRLRKSAISASFIQSKDKNGTILEHPIVRAMLPFKKEANGDIKPDEICKATLITSTGSQLFTYDHSNAMIPRGSVCRAEIEIGTIVACNSGLCMRCEIRNIFIREQAKKPNAADDLTINFLRMR